MKFLYTSIGGGITGIETLINIVQNLKKHKFKQRKKKIINLAIIDKKPENILELMPDDSDEKKGEKLILNGNLREFYQRNSIRLGLDDANDEDLILISDVDEIPLLDKIKFDQLKNQIVFFNQIFCCYKFNLFSFNWQMIINILIQRVDNCPAPLVK